MSASVDPTPRRADEDGGRWPRVGRGLLAGVLGIVAVTGMKLVLYDAIGPATPFLLYFGAVVAATWYGGWAAGLVTTLGAAIVADILFMVDPASWVSVQQSAIFSAECAVLTWLTASLRSAGQRAEQNDAEHTRLFREAEALRLEAAAQRDRLYGMVMAAPISICVLRRPELTFELMNEPYRERLGPLARTGITTREVGLDVANTAMLERAFTTGEPERALEAPVNARYLDGVATHYVNYVVQPLRDAGGEVDRLVVFVQDITDQVTARHKLEAAHHQAQAANRAKDEFLAILGHELRNPLAPIVTALELAEVRGPAVFDRIRGTIDRQVRHMIRLVDDLLDVSRIARGKVELQLQPVVLAEIVARAIEQLSGALGRAGVELDVAVDPALVTRGDPLRLAQIVVNVLGNAVKYTPPGGRIVVAGRRDGSSVELIVRDTGIGIEPEMLPRVFELFVQEGKALDRAGGGLGLGLAIVRGLVEQHGGSVVARSAGAGQGTEIELRLPALEPLASAPAPAIAAGRDSAATRLLLVDDNADALALLALSLESRGHDVTTAHDGPAALDVARAARPAIAILDIGLPGMDGYELARQLRSDAGARPLKLIAITGYGQPADRARALAAGFDEHLVKPASVAAIEGAIARLQQS